VFQLRFRTGDIMSPNDVKRCLRKHKIDTIFHFVAQSHVGLSFGVDLKIRSENEESCKD
jgi:dTDP-glucose 4,6-dehydratase